MKTTWKLIDLMIGRNKKKNSLISKLVYNNKCYTDQSSICDKLNEHFINIGPNLSSQLPSTSTMDPNTYIKRTFQNSFMFRGICIEEVSDLIKGLNINIATVGVPTRCIKLATNNISQALLIPFVYTGVSFRAKHWAN